MSSVGGPGGIGGPKGPGGPAGPEGPDDVAELGADHAVDRTTGAAGAAGTASTSVDAIAAEIAAGRLTAHEAVDKLVDQIAGTDQLAPADRAELREMLTDLVANDPYLAGLINRA